MIYLVCIGLEVAPGQKVQPNAGNLSRRLVGTLAEGGCKVGTSVVAISTEMEVAYECSDTQ